MYTQSFEDAGRDTAAASASVETPQQATTWRQLPPQVNGTNPTSEAQPAHEESLETVLEDSERHLDALWNMLNSQMNRLSNGYAPTTEAQATGVPPLTEQTNRTETAEQPFTDDIAPASQNLTATETIEAQVEAMETRPIAMPFDFMPTLIPSLTLPQEHEAEEVFAGETDTQAEEQPSVSKMDTETEPIAILPDVTETIEYSETLEPTFVAEEREREPIPIPMTHGNSTELPVLGEAAFAHEVAAPVETPVTVAVSQETPRTVSGMLPPIRIDSTFRDNWMVVTAREAGGVTVLPTVKMMMQSQPNQSLKMRSTAMGEMPLGETLLVIIESREEAGCDPSAMRIEIAYRSDAPDVVFEVSSQVEDEVQISMADTGGDLCASWEVSKQKGSYARAKATISRQPGDPEVVIAIQRFRDPSDASVWCSLLSFSVLGR